MVLNYNARFVTFECVDENLQQSSLVLKSFAKDTLKPVGVVVEISLYCVPAANATRIA